MKKPDFVEVFNFIQDHHAKCKRCDDRKLCETGVMLYSMAVHMAACELIPEYSTQFWKGLERLFMEGDTGFGKN